MSHLGQELLTMFRLEAREHLDRIRTVLVGGGEGTDPGSGSDLDEMFRRAHSLKGAARAVEQEEIESQAHHLENVFQRIRAGEESLQEVSDAVAQALDELEDTVTLLEKGETPPEHPGEKGKGEDSLVVEHAGGTDMLYLNAGDLDRLLLTADQLSAELRRQEKLHRELGRLFQGLLSWQEEKAARSLQRPGPDPEESGSGPGKAGSNGSHEGHRRLGQEVRSIWKKSHHHHREMRSLAHRFTEELRQTCMTPVSSVFQGLGTMVRDLARDQGKQVQFHSSGWEHQADRAVLQKLRDPILHLLRNAVTHGIEAPEERKGAGKTRSGRVSLAVTSRGNRLSVRVEDDGRGIDLERVSRLASEKGLLNGHGKELPASEELTEVLFEPSFSTRKEADAFSGRGMGLSAVRESLLRLQGEAHLETIPAGGTAAVITVPIWMAFHDLVLARAGGQTFGLPVPYVSGLYRVGAADLRLSQGRHVLTLDGQEVPVTALGFLLGLEDTGVRTDGDALSLALLRTGSDTRAWAVDSFLGYHRVAVRELPPCFGHNFRFSGVFLSDEGQVQLVLNMNDLLSRGGSEGRVKFEEAVEGRERVRTVLVADDSITTRALQRSLLEANGYRVLVAVDGQQALQILQREKEIDLVVSDIQMPRLDGFGLLKEIKGQGRLKELPVILVSSLDSPEDQQLGLELGAEAYIVKKKFDQKELLETIEQLL